MFTQDSMIIPAYPQPIFLHVGDSLRAGESGNLFEVSLLDSKVEATGFGGHRGEPDVINGHCSSVVGKLTICVFLAWLLMQIAEKRGHKRCFSLLAMRFDAFWLHRVLLFSIAGFGCVLQTGLFKTISQSTQWRSRGND